MSSAHLEIGKRNERPRSGTPRSANNSARRSAIAPVDDHRYGLNERALLLTLQEPRWLRRSTLPVVVVSSTTATRSDVSPAGPTTRPPMPWSFAAFRTEKAFSGRFGHDRGGDGYRIGAHRHPAHGRNTVRAARHRPPQRQRDGHPEPSNVVCLTVEIPIRYRHPEASRKGPSIRNAHGASRMVDQSARL